MIHETQKVRFGCGRVKHLDIVTVIANKYRVNKVSVLHLRYLFIGNKNRWTNLAVKSVIAEQNVLFDYVKTVMNKLSFLVTQSKL